MTQQQFRPAAGGIAVLPVTGLPEITAGADLAALIARRRWPVPACSTATSW